jgi:hypothetical protein
LAGNDGDFSTAVGPGKKDSIVLTCVASSI